jgi:hypothetical protein
MLPVNELRSRTQQFVMNVVKHSWPNVAIESIPCDGLVSVICEYVERTANAFDVLRELQYDLYFYESCMSIHIHIRYVDEYGHMATHIVSRARIVIALRTCHHEDGTSHYVFGVQSVDLDDEQQAERVYWVANGPRIDMIVDAMSANTVYNKHAIEHQLECISADSYGGHQS